LPSFSKQFFEVDICIQFVWFIVCLIIGFSIVFLILLISTVVCYEMRSVVLNSHQNISRWKNILLHQKPF